MPGIARIRLPSTDGIAIVHASTRRDFSLIKSLSGQLDNSLGVFAVHPPEYSISDPDLESLAARQIEEIRPSIHPGQHLYLIGDCIAGHLTLNMARLLTGLGLTPCKTVLLDTRPVDSYSEMDSFKILGLPGGLSDYGRLGEALVELETGSEKDPASLANWATSLFAALYDNRKSLTKGLERCGIKYALRTEAWYLDWAKLVCLALASPSVKYAGPVDLLVSDDVDGIPLLARWNRQLGDSSLGRTETTHSNILISPSIKKALRCKLSFH